MYRRHISLADADGEHRVTFWNLIHVGYYHEIYIYICVCVCVYIYIYMVIHICVCGSIYIH
jgi:hypothetical protein